MVIAIVAVIFLGCVTVIVYWKVQNAKESVDNSPQKSGTTLAKCRSTQLTDLRENTSIQSFVLNEVTAIAYVCPFLRDGESWILIARNDSLTSKRRSWAVIPHD